MSACQVYIEGVSLLGPALNNWQEAIPILRGEVAWESQPVKLPPPEVLPAAERRRAGEAIKLSMAVGLAAVRDAGADPATLANVFSSTGGDCENCHAILDVLASPDRQISPTRFHNSVHNAPAGYWGIGTHCTEASTSLCTYDASFSAGLLEAAAQALVTGQPCLLVAFDTAYPEPLYSLRPIPYAFGIGMVISPVKTAASKATISMSLADEPACKMEDDQLEWLRCEAPAARGLPVLQMLATGSSGRVVVDYIDQINLAIEVSV
jgi:hypothetical protein